MPKGIVSTGFPAVEAKCVDLGLRFRWWQKPIGQLILSKRADGKYATTVGGVGLSIPRQVGKTFLVGAIVFALCLLRPNLTVVWSAHRVRTAEETFKKMQALARRKKIAPFIANVVLGSGEEAIEFTNGSRILFGARAAGFGRGYDEVDIVVYDEAQILDENALDDMIPAMNQSRQPEGALMLFMGTPPKPAARGAVDKGTYFTGMRTEALSGQDDDTAWVEFGSDPGYVFTPLPAPLSETDWAQIAKANPSFPEDTPREAILRMRKKLGPDSFGREGAGIWDEVDSTPSVFGAGRWEAGFFEGELPDAPHAIGVAVSVDRLHASIAAASALDADADDEAEQVLVAASDRREEVGWLVAEVKRIQTEHGCMVVIDEKGPTAELIEALEDADVALTLVDLSEYVAACSKFFDRVRAGTLLHAQHEWLDTAVKGAAWRSVGDGRQVWGRRKSSSDVSMLEAATLAAYGAEQSSGFNIY